MTEAQKCLYHIAENMRMDKSISKEGYEYFQQAIKALEQQPNRCDSCIHSEEQDGSNCYECVKGIADNFEAQQTKMRDAIDVLDMIRAEIESQRKEVSYKNSEDDKLRFYYYGLNDGLKDARDIIDKYKAESEDKQ